MSKFTIEKHLRIYDDRDGSYLEVRPDSDSLGLIEINRCDGNGKKEFKLTLTIEEADLLSKTLVDIRKDNSLLEQKNETVNA